MSHALIDLCATHSEGGLQHIPCRYTAIYESKGRFLRLDVHDLAAWRAGLGQFGAKPPTGTLTPIPADEARQLCAQVHFEVLKPELIWPTGIPTTV